MLLGPAGAAGPAGLVGPAGLAGPAVGLAGPAAPSVGGVICAGFRGFLRLIGVPGLSGKHSFTYKNVYSGPETLIFSPECLILHKFRVQIERF